MSIDTEDVYTSGLYDKVMTTGLIGRYWNKIHRNMEKPFDKRTFPTILEIGAGTGQHFQFVKCEFNKYFETDIRLNLLINSTRSRHKRIRRECQDVQELTFKDSYFDRVIVTCVLAHVEDVLKSLKEIRRVCKDGGVITIYLPTEPGLFLRIVRSLSTVAKNYRLGVSDPYFSHFQEHRNYFLAVNHFIKSIYADSNVNRRYFPFKGLSWNLNLYAIYQIELKKSTK